MDISYEEVGQLLRLIEQLECETVTLEVGDLRLHVSRSGAASAPANGGAPASEAAAAAPDVSAPAPPPPAGEAAALGEAEGPAGCVAIEAPMVGTFYRAPSPDEPPFVEVGDTVTVDQQVGIIEVMKLMNDLTSSVAGRVVRIDAENAAAVGYGDTLIWIEPTA